MRRKTAASSPAPRRRKKRRAKAEPFVGFTVNTGNGGSGASWTYSAPVVWCGKSKCPTCGKKR